MLECVGVLIWVLRIKTNFFSMASADETFTCTYFSKDDVGWMILDDEFPNPPVGLIGTEAISGLRHKWSLRIDFHKCFYIFGARGQDHESWLTSTGEPLAQ